MATIQLHPEPQGSYKSPYSFVSTYDKWPALDQGGIKVLDTTRSNEAPTHRPTSSHHLIDREQTIINLDSDTNDGFIDIDELLSDMQQRSITPKSTAQKMEIRFASGSSAAFGQPVEENTHILVIPSIDKFVTAKAESDHRSIEVDLTAISDSDPPRNTSSDTAHGTGSASRTTFTSDRIVADHQDDDNDSDIVDDARLPLAASLLRSTSPGHGSVIHQASPIPVNPEVIHAIASCGDLNVIQEAEDEVVDVFAYDDKDDADTCFPKRSDSSAVSCNKPASDRNIFESLASQHDPAQVPQRGRAATSVQQSELTKDSLSTHDRQRAGTRSAHRKRSRIPVPTRPASTATLVSFPPGSNEFDYTQSVTRLTAPVQERESDNDQEMGDDGGSDDSDDQDYDATNDAAASEMRHPTRSRKRVKRVKDREPSEVETPSTQSLNVSCQAIAATSINMQESEEIPIRGSLILKTVGSGVMYCLTFSQEVFPESGRTSERQPRSVSSSSDRRDSDQLSIQEGAISRSIKKSQFSTQEDDLLRQLKGEGISWDEIKDRFSDRFHERSEGFHERSKGALQVHYSTKLKPRSKTSKITKRRRRFE